MAGRSARDKQQEFVEAAKRAADRFRAEMRACAGRKPVLTPLPGGRAATDEARRGDAPVERRRAG